MSKTDRNLTPGKKTHIYTEAQLAVLVSPRTREVFDALCESKEMSVSQLQRALGVQSKTIYYQVRKLVKSGLVTSEMPEIGPERFKVIAENFSMPSGYQGVAYERMAAKAVESVMRKQSRQFRAASEASESDSSIIDWLYIRTATLNLSTSRFESLKTDLTALLERYSGKLDAEQTSIDVLFVTTPKNR
jgi:DNA-binding transcriptional ArsR family regulator